MSGPGDRGSADHRDGEGANPDADRLIRWLAAQPRDATVVWTDPTLDERTVFASEWVDVSLGGDEGPDAVLTLSAPGNAEDADDPLDSVELTYDAVREVTFADGKVAAMRLLPDDGEPLDLDDGQLKQELEDEEQWSFFWRGRMTRDPARPARWTQRVWTLDRVALCLSEWASAFAGRGDLRFSFAVAPGLDHDPRQPAGDEGQPSASGDDVLQIGDGVFARPEVFDELLAMDPDDAAEITRDMQARADAIRATPLRRPGE